MVRARPVSWLVDHRVASPSRPRPVVIDTRYPPTVAGAAAALGPDWVVPVRIPVSSPDAWRHRGTMQAHLSVFRTRKSRACHSALGTLCSVYHIYDMTIPFDNSYARLPDRFYAAQPPVPVAEPSIVAVNEPLARTLGIDPGVLTADILSGNAVLDGATPIATAYAGHQFGNFVSQLGDGRAVLLGEVDTPKGRFDIQLKGSGPTPFSRNGDGRAALGPVIREYILSEAMHALGIPTTRALGAALTGESVFRETELPGAVLTRVAQSHIRVGTFQYFYARQDKDALQQLSDHVIDRHYPSARNADIPALDMLRQVMSRQADLIAKWMQVGFIHGVMNTDNMTVSGETIDYGPCAFMDVYHPEMVFSSIDQRGRYAWINQPKIAHWNLSQLAQSLLPIIGEDKIPAAQVVLDGFSTQFDTAFVAGFSRKIGVAANETLVAEMLRIMAEGQVDFTLFFRRLADGTARDLFTDPTAFDGWAQKWEALSPDQTQMRETNPVYIPRNHRVEEAIVAANIGNYAPFETILAVLAAPFTVRPEFADYETPPTADQQVHQTFCGT